MKRIQPPFNKPLTFQFDQARQSTGPVPAPALVLAPALVPAAGVKNKFKNWLHNRVM